MLLGQEKVSSPQGMFSLRGGDRKDDPTEKTCHRPVEAERTAVEPRQSCRELGHLLQSCSPLLVSYVALKGCDPRAA